MCGRYALALRPSQIRQILQDDDMPVYDAPADEGDGAPRQSYNFAPGYYGVVYRADVPDWGAGTAARGGRQAADAAAAAAAADSTGADREGKGGGDDDAAAEASRSVEQDPHHPASFSSDACPAPTQTRYKLQAMKWGLVPSWTKRQPPSYGAMLKTINCRDDSLAAPGGMWASMKARKRCVVVAEGFYEWLKQGPKEKVPHYVRRRDGKLMCFAGLWDCVRYDGEGEDGASEGGGGAGGGGGGGGGEAPSRKQYTYTIITTDSNAQLRFLHDRMPVILEPGSDALWTWLDPARSEWSRELQALLKPFAGELEVYPVSKEVGKVGNNSPSFVIPVASRENKANIANFFAKGAAGKKETKRGNVGPEVEITTEPASGQAGGEETTETKPVAELEMAAQYRRNINDEDEGDDDSRDQKRSTAPKTTGVTTKRKAEMLPSKDEPPTKKQTSAPSPSSGFPSKTASPVKGTKTPGLGRGKISATSNAAAGAASARSPAKGRAKSDGSQKITKFFGNSA